MSKRILIAGDIMLDTYHFGQVERISPEAPVPVFLETGRTKDALGGAANVAVNVAAIGVQVYVCSIIGQDESGRKLLKLLRDAGIDVEYIFSCDSKPTTVKLRYIGQNNQQIMRSDTENSTMVLKEDMQSILSRIEERIVDYDLILLSDYCKGFLSNEITHFFISIGKLYDIPVIIDVKDRNIEKYRGATLLKPNRKELSELTGMKTDTLDNSVKAAISLCRKGNNDYVLATLGSDGMILVNKSGLLREVRSSAREIYDVTGAGDTSVAYLAAEMINGKNIEEAMLVANYAAGVQVSKMGTSIVQPREVYEIIEKDKNVCAFGSKILSSLEDGLTDKDSHSENITVFSEIEECRRMGAKIVFTNGCFDILHVGHVSYLQKARQFGDVLVVGVNSDDSVKRLKGSKRPINTLFDREQLLAALSPVDFVIPFEEDTPMRLIEAVSPDVLVKGGDYKKEEIVGADFVKSRGGEVRIIPFMAGYSTTGTIDRMRRAHRCL